MADVRAYSVVIPAFNAAATIGDAIDSVLAQTVPAAEIIVVDDGSTDGTADVAAAYSRVRIVRQDNFGPGVATTRGLAQCREPVVALLDADDLWLPVKMERQLGYLENGEADAVFARVELFGDRLSTGEIRDGWLRSTMVMRPRAFDLVGPVVDPPGRRGEMIGWLAKARACGLRLKLLQEVLTRRRVTPTSLSYGRDPDRDRGYLHVVRQQILRRRQGTRP